MSDILHPVPYERCLDRYVQEAGKPPPPAYVLDIETTIIGRSPSAADGASIVMVGLRAPDGPIMHFDKLGVDLLLKYVPLPGAVLVGHNIKFDLVHLMKYCGIRKTLEWLCRFSAVIDTSINQYLHSAQSHKFPSLRECADVYGVSMPVKDVVHDQYFAKGLGADEVPEKLLIEYLDSDLRATYEVFQGQYRAATCQMRGHHFVQGWATVLYAWMQSFGIGFEYFKVKEMKDEREKTYARRDKVLKDWVLSAMPEIASVPDWELTPRTLSTVLFGEPGVPYKEKIVVGKYKNGKPMTRSVEKRAKPAEPLVPVLGVHGYTEMNPNLGWPVSDSVLTDIEKKHKGKLPAKIAAITREWRRDAKIMSTYLDPLLRKSGLCVPGGPGALIVRNPEYNQTVTATGRLSSSSPNAQNMPEEIKALVTGNIVNMDFSQLEVWAAAVLSGDPQMLHDVQYSDVHYETGRATMGWTDPDKVSKKDRRAIKGVNFGIIYGGGAPTIAKQTDVPEGKVRKHMAHFKRRYPKFTAWQNDRLKEVEAAPKVIAGTDKDGHSYYKASVESVTGRWYQFTQRWVDWKSSYSFSPPEVKNYPVQGFATADVVPLFLINLFFWTPVGGSRMGACPFVAVHDSCSIEVMDNHYFADIEVQAQAVAASLPNLIRLTYRYASVRCAPKIEVELSDHWA